MTEKVKLTQAQADEVKRIKDIDYAINIHPLNKRPDSPLRNLSVAAIARALYVGYEVELEYSVGDWIYRERDMVISKITKIDYGMNVSGSIFTDAYTGRLFKDEIRHATESEIVAEKGRRMNKKLDAILLDLSSEERIRLQGKLNCGDANELSNS